MCSTDCSGSCKSTPEKIQIKKITILIHSLSLSSLLSPSPPLSSLLFYFAPLLSCLTPSCPHSLLLSRLHIPVSFKYDSFILFIFSAVSSCRCCNNKKNKQQVSAQSLCCPFSFHSPALSCSSMFLNSVLLCSSSLNSLLLLCFCAFVCFFLKTHTCHLLLHY